MDDLLLIRNWGQTGISLFYRLLNNWENAKKQKVTYKAIAQDLSVYKSWHYQIYCFLHKLYDNTWENFEKLHNYMNKWNITNIFWISFNEFQQNSWEWKINSTESDIWVAFAW